MCDAPRMADGQWRFLRDQHESASSRAVSRTWRWHGPALVHRGSQSAPASSAREEVRHIRLMVEHISGPLRLCGVKYGGRIERFAPRHQLRRGVGTNDERGTCSTARCRCASRSEPASGDVTNHPSDLHTAADDRLPTLARMSFWLSESGSTLIVSTPGTPSSGAGDGTADNPPSRRTNCGFCRIPSGRSNRSARPGCIERSDFDRLAPFAQPPRPYR